jgi:hypothetical protein
MVRDLGAFDRDHAGFLSEMQIAGRKRCKDMTKH